MKTTISFRRNDKILFFEGRFISMPKNQNCMETELVFDNPYRRVRMDSYGPFILIGGQRVDVVVTMGELDR